MHNRELEPKVGDRLDIDGQSYVFQPNPAVKSIAYTLEGGRGKVHKVTEEQTGRAYALKTFRKKWRTHEIEQSAGGLTAYRHLPGMEVCDRKILTPDTHAELINQYDDLRYAVLMPWIDGTTWFDYIFGDQDVHQKESLSIASSTIQILTMLEDMRSAHTDIAGANVIVGKTNGQSGNSSYISLVDVEEMYGPSMPRPIEIPAGQAGYQHKTAQAKGNWHPYGDRFGGAVLLAEMLSWHNPDVRAAASGEGSYFLASEMQDPKDARYQILMKALQTDYSGDVADLFRQAWESDLIEGCPSLGNWATALECFASSAASTPLKRRSPLGRSAEQERKGFIEASATPPPIYRSEHVDRHRVGQNGTVAEHPILPKPLEESEDTHNPWILRIVIAVGILGIIAVAILLCGGIAFSRLFASHPSPTTETIFVTATQHTETVALDATPVPTQITLTPTDDVLSEDRTEQDPISGLPVPVTQMLTEVRKISSDSFDWLNKDYWNYYATTGSVEAIDGELHIPGSFQWGTQFRQQIYDLNSGNAVLARFKFEPETEFSLYVESGTWKEPSYRCWGLETGKYYRTNIWEGAEAIGRQSLSGSLTEMQARTYYELLLAVGNNGEMLMYVWDSSDPSQYAGEHTQFGSNWAGLTWGFMINAASGEIWLDNFQVLSFNNLK